MCLAIVRTMGCCLVLLVVKLMIENVLFLFCDSRDLSQALFIFVRVGVIYEFLVLRFVLLLLYC